MADLFIRDVRALTQQLASLPKPSDVAKVFACSAERFFPVYRDFVNEFKWGDTALFRHLLDNLWTGISGNVIADGFVTEANGLAPHADDFDNLKATIAQDACVCLSAGGGWLIGGDGRKAEYIEYSLEAIKVVVCVELTGCLDLGDDQESGGIFEMLVKDARYQAEYDSIVRSIRSAGSPLDELKRDSERNAWSFDRLRI